MQNICYILIILVILVVLIIIIIIGFGLLLRGYSKEQFNNLYYDGRRCSKCVSSDLEYNIPHNDIYNKYTYPYLFPYSYRYVYDDSNKSIKWHPFFTEYNLRQNEYTPNPNIIRSDDPPHLKGMKAQANYRNNDGYGRIMKITGYDDVGKLPDYADLDGV